MYALHLATVSGSHGVTVLSLKWNHWPKKRGEETIYMHNFPPWHQTLKIHKNQRVENLALESYLHVLHMMCSGLIPPCLKSEKCKCKTNCILPFTMTIYTIPLAKNTFPYQGNLPWAMVNHYCCKIILIASTTTTPSFML